MFIRLFINTMAAGFFILLNANSVPAKDRVIIPGCINIIHEDEEGKKLSYPSSIFFETVKEEIYLVDSGHSRILIYTADFFPLYTLDKDDGIFTPTCLAVDSRGYIFVGQSFSPMDTRSRISVFNPCLKWKYNIYFDKFPGAEKFVPKNIALDGEGNIYLAGTNIVGILILDKKGKYVYTMSPERVTICDMEIDRAGNIYLLSEEMGKIYIYDKSGELIVKFGEKGGGTGKLSRPRGISVDTLRERIYIIDYMRHTANVYDTRGEFLFEFGGKGWGKGWFQYPSDICVGRAGHALIADTFNNRVQVLEIK